MSSSTIPNFEIHYRDGSSLVEEHPVSKDRQEVLFKYAMQALSLGADIRNPFPIYINGIENFHALRSESAIQKMSMQSLRSNSEYGIIE